MSDKNSMSRLRSALRTARAAHRRSSDEWIRRMEFPATRGYGRRL